MNLQSIVERKRKKLSSPLIVLILGVAFTSMPASSDGASMHNQSHEELSKTTYVVTRGTAESSMPVPQGGVNLDGHGFRFFCVPSHFSYDDPVVYPGQVGAAHLHMFFGNTDVNAHTTSESILQSGLSTCDGGLTNRSAYWIPALFNENDEVVLPTSINNYYKSWISNRKQIKPIPAGLQILTNDKIKGSSGVVVSNVDRELWAGTIRISGKDGLTIEIIFPDCLAIDKEGNPVLSSPGGVKHVAYSSGRCPISHPYAIPQLTQTIYWDNVLFESDWYLASDKMANAAKGTTAHADYIAGWTEEAAQIMSDCVMEGIRECGPALQLHAADQFFSPSGERVYDFFTLAEGTNPTPNAMHGWPYMLPHEGSQRH